MILNVDQELTDSTTCLLHRSSTKISAFSKILPKITKSCYMNYDQIGTYSFGFSDSLMSLFLIVAAIIFEAVG